MMTGDPSVQPYDFLCSTNEDCIRTLTVTVLETGAVQDVTGWTVVLSIYASWAAKECGQDALISISTSSGIAATDEANGEFTLTISKESMPDVTEKVQTGYTIPRRECVYDCLMLDSDGHRMRTLAGKWVFELGGSVSA